MNLYYPTRVACAPAMFSLTANALRNATAQCRWLSDGMQLLVAVQIVCSSPLFPRHMETK